MRMVIDESSCKDRLASIEDHMKKAPNLTARDASDVYIGEIAVYTAAIADELREIKEILKKESEERKMEMLYVVTADGYDDGYGSELYLLGVFKDEESAKALEEKYSHLEVTITAVELGKVYPLSPNERGWGLTYENDHYLGGYVE